MKKMIAVAMLISFIFALSAGAAEQMPQANNKQQQPMTAEEKAKAEAERGAYSPKSITEDNIRLSPAMTPKRSRPLDPIIPWWQRG